MNTASRSSACSSAPTRTGMTATPATTCSSAAGSTAFGAFRLRTWCNCLPPWGPPQPETCPGRLSGALRAIGRVFGPPRAPNRGEVQKSYRERRPDGRCQRCGRCERCERCERRERRERPVFRRVPRSSLCRPPSNRPVGRRRDMTGLMTSWATASRFVSPPQPDLRSCLAAGLRAGSRNFLD